jgi:hypothetical protein
MEQAAHRSGARVRYLAGEHRLTVDDGVSLTFDASSSEQADAGAATITLNYHGARIVLVDAEASNDTFWNQINETASAAQILVSLRTPGSLAGHGAQVAIQLVARRSSDLAAAGAQFTGNLDTGSRLTIRLRPGEIRIPMNRLTPAATSSPEPDTAA